MSDILSLKKTAAAVLVSGNGTNLQALIDNQQKNSDCPYKINVVISDNPGAFALTRAEKAGIKTYVLEKGNLKGQSLRDYRTRQILEILRKEKTDILVLAGFLTILSENLINEFPERIINIHPALLPDFLPEKKSRDVLSILLIKVAIQEGLFCKERFLLWQVILPIRWQTGFIKKNI